MTKQLKRIEIYWDDSGSNEGVWCDKDDYPDEAGKCVTIGYLIKKTAKTYVLAQSWSDNQYGNIFVIPKQSVTLVKYL